MATKDDKKSNDVTAPKSDDAASHAQITPTIDATNPEIGRASCRERV